MEFKFNDFTCHTEKYMLDDKSFVVKFFDKKKEHSESEICNFVQVDSGYGYMSLKFKGEDALLSGFLDDTIFANEARIDAAIDFVESMSPHAKEAYIPYRIMKVKFTGSVEYNGEE